MFSALPKAVTKAARPTYQAAPILLPSQQLAAMRSRSANRSRQTLDLLKQARDYNPDVAKAVDNLVSLCNPGYELNCYYANSANDGGEAKQDIEGLRLVRQFAVRMFSEYSGAWDEPAGKDSPLPGLDAFLAMTHLTIATQGAMAAEAELTEDLKDIVDIYPVDPSIIDFRMDEKRRLVPGIILQSPFTPLDPIRFRYVPLSPDPMDPGGRSPLLAVLDVVFFQQQLMRELKAIAHMSNAPRLDVKVLNEVVVQALQSVRPDLMAPDKIIERNTFLNGYLSDIESVIEGLEVDDAFIHWDSVEAQFIGPQGTAIPVDALMNAVDKMMISGVKQLPLLLGRNEGATTTHAGVQWQVFIRQLEMYQRISRAMVSWALNLYLRIQGRQSYITFKYMQHKTSDEYQDAQALALNVASWKTLAEIGWATEDEASIELLGHAPEGVKMTLSQPVIISAKEAVQGENQQETGASANGRAPEIRVIGGSAPSWVLRATFDTQHQYAQWRDLSIASRFSKALDTLRRDAKQVEAMTNADARRWLGKQLSVDSPAQNRLNESLRHAGRRATAATIEEQLRAIGKPRQIKLGDRGLLKAIDDQARESTKSIVASYNDELAAAIQMTLDDLTASETRDGGSMADKLRTAITRLASWEGTRNAWKAAQVALTETQANIMRSIKEFFTRNEVSGEAEVYPYESTPDDCAEYIRNNPYPSVPDALQRTILPNHIGCPHFVRLVATGEYVGRDELWAGE